MKLGMGIDFGTSNSSVALFDGQVVTRVALDPAAPPPGDVMPTALYLDRRLAATIGQAAIDRYIRENVGRTVTLRRELVGDVTFTVADTDETRPGDGLQVSATVHAYTDQEQPGRLFRGVKRWLGNAKLDTVRVFGHRFRIVSLVTPILAQLERLTRETRPPGAVVYVGRPVHYEGGADAADGTAVERMREACGYAGLGASAPWLEPIAATLSYLHDRPDSGERIVLAYDFGGGTLDLSLIRARGATWEILATRGLGFGGDEINRMLFRAKVFPELGLGTEQRVPVATAWKRVRFPFERFAPRLLNWPMAYELNRPELRETIVQGMREGGDTRLKLGRLLELITRNRAYAVVQAIEGAKVELSSRTHARIREESLDLDVAVSRAELDRLLEPWLDRVDSCLDSLLEAADLPAAAVDVVVRTGGSSSIPAAIARLERRFPGRVVEHDRFTSIAAGLAIASFRALAE